MRKAAARTRINNLEKNRRKSVADLAAKQLSEIPSKKFDRLRTFTADYGISDGQLKSSIAKNKGNVSGIMKDLGLGQNTTAMKNKFDNSDGLFEDPPEPYDSSKYKLGSRDKVSDFRIENEPTQFRPVLRKMDRKNTTRTPSGQIFPSGSDLLISNKQKTQELNDRIIKIQRETPHQVDTPYTFPTTEFDYNLESAILSSIKNYNLKKNKYKVAAGGAQYSDLSNQL